MSWGILTPSRVAWGASLVVCAAFGGVSGSAEAAQLPLPSSNTLNVAGPALFVLNAHVYTGPGDTAAVAIRGTASGALGVGLSGVASADTGIGVFGSATGTNGVGVRGLYTAGTPNATGFGGQFLLAGAQPSGTSAALVARATSGGASAAGAYGAAGLFQVTNVLNTSPALQAVTRGSGFAGVVTGTNALQVNGRFQISQGAQSGYVLTSDGSGFATWAAAAAGPQGPVGPQGPQGDRGPQGIQGVHGIMEHPPQEENRLVA